MQIKYQNFCMRMIKVKQVFKMGNFDSFRDNCVKKPNLYYFQE